MMLHSIIIWLAQTHMDEASRKQAFKRIEAALARIGEAIARRDASEAELRSRYEKLKTAVARSLDQIDRLIAGRRR